VKLLDINPAYGTTQPLLFTWDELTELSSGSPSDSRSGYGHNSVNENTVQAPEGAGCELRTVQDPMHIQSSAKSLFGAPVDTLDMPGMSWPGVFDMLQEQCCLQAADND
jgi:D123